MNLLVDTPTFDNTPNVVVTSGDSVNVALIKSGRVQFAANTVFSGTIAVGTFGPNAHAEILAGATEVSGLINMGGTITSARDMNSAVAGFSLIVCAGGVTTITGLISSIGQVIIGGGRLDYTPLPTASTSPLFLVLNGVMDLSGNTQDINIGALIAGPLGALLSNVPQFIPTASKYRIDLREQFPKVE